MHNIVERLKKESRFYINKTTLNCLLNRGEIRSYKLVKIPLNKIRRRYKGLHSLESTDVYHFLENPNDKNYRQKYLEYCNIPGARKDNPDRSVETFEKLINEFANMEYDIKNGIIVVDQFYQVQEGFHRSCILLKNKGGSYKIEVLKIVYRYKINRKFIEMVRDNIIFEIKRILRTK